MRKHFIKLHTDNSSIFFLLSNFDLFNITERRENQCLAMIYNYERLSTFGDSDRIKTTGTAIFSLNHRFFYQDKVILHYNNYLFFDYFDRQKKMFEEFN